MIPSSNCEYCSHDVPPAEHRCPHCGQPSRFPNVIIANSQQSSLQTRYDAAKSEALSRNAVAQVDDFEEALNHSRAVINRPLHELNRLAESLSEVYATYYQLSEGIKLIEGNEFDAPRRAADFFFFTGFEKEIRFAALSLDSFGLVNYGDCSLVLREEMIAHRASVFLENTTLYFNKHNIKVAKDIPEGLRAIWADRAKLCVAKLAEKIDTTTTPAEYSGILLHQGATSAEDEIVEVHIFGPMTILTIEEVTFTAKIRNKAEQAIIKGVKEKLGKYGVKVN